MGVPKFYRWLSERYPQINVVLSDNSLLPEFDNMYLDMNGIIHACTHPNDNDTANSLTMREMMLAIMRYIDRMVSEIAKPRKILFMAIDGCAPRAKMNQQRARRFRSAQDRLESIMKAKQDGQVFDENALFDSNCITPGTEFMEQVGKHLRWFIRKKIKEDPLWRNLEIVFSGHDVPGEGEHKIMQFIRDLRARPNYEANQRHCMYGGDADLIMLGLATHEPHFCLLKEVVNFNRPFGPRQGTRQTIIRQTKEVQFQLMHLSIIREYLELDLALGCGRNVDKERLVDDFIFLTFLVGNDFLPHLPTLDIGEHAFDTVFGAYKVLLQESEGYLVTMGELKDLKRLESLFSIIGQQEQQILEDRELEVKRFKSKRRGASKAELQKQAEEDEVEEAAKVKAYTLAMQEAQLELTGDHEVEPKATAVVNAGEGNGDDDKGTKDDEGAVKPGELVSFSSKNYRGRYYFEKYKIVPETPSGNKFLTELTDSYLEGLMWCLAYYIKGCISWTWYYPYHYGIMCADMTNLEGKVARIGFELGQPFLPFQQLLGCLPPLSKGLLPKSYQWLMTAEDSPLLDFYPHDFEVDQDGKRNPWEAVVLLPFIEEARLKTAEKTHCAIDKLGKDERDRNVFGNVLVYRFDPTCNDNYLSCNPEIGLPDINKCQSSCTEVEPDYNCGHPFYPEVVEGTISPIAGYPSLGVLNIVNIDTDFQQVNVFGSASKYRTISIEYQPKKYNPEKLDISKLLGRHCWCNYPSMHEARVIAVSDGQQEYRIKSGEMQHTPHSHHSREKWHEKAMEEETRYLKGAGIPGTAGLVIGKIELMIHVVPLQGMRKNPVTGALKKVFGTTEALVPLQLVLWSQTVADPRFIEREQQSIEELFPVGSPVIGTVGQFRGVKGYVLASHGGKGESRSVDVEFTIPPKEPSFGYIIQASATEEYYSSGDICRALRISSNVMGRVVGALFVDHPSRADLGLNLKRNGQYTLQGYVRKVEGHDATSTRDVGENSVWQRTNAVKVIGSTDGSDVIQEKARDIWEYSARTVNLLL